MPKPKYGMCGSGMHINMSLSDKEGNNILPKLMMKTDLARKHTAL